MEESAVDDGVEGLAEGVEAERVEHSEGGLGGAALRRDIDGARRELRGASRARGQLSHVGFRNQERVGERWSNLPVGSLAPKAGGGDG